MMSVITYFGSHKWPKFTVSALTAGSLVTAVVSKKDGPGKPPVNNADVTVVVQMASATSSYIMAPIGVPDTMRGETIYTRLNEPTQRGYVLSKIWTDPSSGSTF